MQWKAISKFYLRNTNRDECWTTFERQPTKLRANEKNYIFMILFQFSVDAHTCNRSLQWYIIKENHRMKPSYNEINAFKQWPNHGGMSLPNRNSVSFLSHNNVILIYMRRKEQCECLQIEKSKWPTKEKKNECCKIQIMVQPVKNRWLFMHATVNGFKNKYNFHGKKNHSNYYFACETCTKITVVAVVWFTQSTNEGSGVLFFLRKRLAAISKCWKASMNSKSFCFITWMSNSPAIMSLYIYG